MVTSVIISSRGLCLSLFLLSYQPKCYSFIHSWPLSLSSQIGSRFTFRFELQCVCVCRFYEYAFVYSFVCVYNWRQKRGVSGLVNDSPIIEKRFWSVSQLGRFLITAPRLSLTQLLAQFRSQHLLEYVVDEFVLRPLPKWLFGFFWRAHRLLPAPVIEWETHFTKRVGGWGRISPGLMDWFLARSMPCLLQTFYQQNKNENVISIFIYCLLPTKQEGKVRLHV